MALTVTQVEAIRRAVRAWRRGTGLSGPKPDGQLEAIIEVMLGTSPGSGRCSRSAGATSTSRSRRRPSGSAARSSHRRGSRPTGRPTQDREVDPDRVGAVVRRRGTAAAARLIPPDDRTHLIFHSRNGTPLTTNNVRRRLRAILEEAGISGVTPHSFRRTVATVIDRAAGADLAAEMLATPPPRSPSCTTSSPTRK